MQAPTRSGARRAGWASRTAASAFGAVCIAQWPNGMFWLSGSYPLWI